MTDTSALRAFIEARLAEDEWWARNAGTHYDFVPPEIGQHWHWVETTHDQPVTPDPTAGEHLDYPEGEESRALALRSVEEYPTNMPYSLPTFIISTAEEVNTTAAGHIARHDPARVLREVAAKRAILTLIERVEAMEDRIDGEWPIGWPTDYPSTELLALLAAAYVDHPDYDPSWSTA